LKVGHLVQSALSVGSTMSKLRTEFRPPNRWQAGAHFSDEASPLVQIQAQVPKERFSTGLDTLPANASAHFQSFDNRP
jgi:hypothetical protein